MKGKCIKYDEMPKREGSYQSWDSAFEVVENNEKKVVGGMTKSKFVVGQEFEFSLEVRTSKAGNPYNYIKRVTQDNASQRYQKDYVSTIISTGTSYAIDLYMKEPFKAAKFVDIQAPIVTSMLNAITSASTPREKEFLSYAMSYALRVYEDDDHTKRFREVKKYDGKDYKQELELVIAIFQMIYKTMLDINKTT